MKGYTKIENHENNQRGQEFSTKRFGQGKKFSKFKNQPVKLSVWNKLFGEGNEDDKSRLPS